MNRYIYFFALAMIASAIFGFAGGFGLGLFYRGKRATSSEVVARQIDTLKPKCPTKLLPIQYLKEAQKYILQTEIEKYSKEKIISAIEFEIQLDEWGLIRALGKEAYEKLKREAE